MGAPCTSEPSAALTITSLPAVPTSMRWPSAERHTERTDGFEPNADMSNVAPGSSASVHSLTLRSTPPLTTPCAHVNAR